MLEGWLTKRRDHINIVWMERYFILDGNQLRYYKKRGDPGPRGTYVLTPGCVVGEVFHSSVKHRHHSPVWMFRITFAVEEGEKRSYKKDRFVDLGAKTAEDANQWKRELETSIDWVRQRAKERTEKGITAEIGAPPPAVQQMLRRDDELLFNLDKNTETSAEWWSVGGQDGVRIMQECPHGIKAAAVEYASQADKMNEVLVCVFICAMSGLLIPRMFTTNILVGLISAIVTTGFYVFIYLWMAERKKDIPSFRVSQVVYGSAKDVFQLLMNPKVAHRWDGSIMDCRIIASIDKHADVIYSAHRPVFIWPLWQKPRDLVLMRYWCREEDGSYFIIYQSTSHPECRPSTKYVRGSMIASAFVIAPQKNPSGGVRCLVTHIVRYDAMGMSALFHRFGLSLQLVSPLLMRVVGIRDEMSQTNFLQSNVSATADEEAPSTSIDHLGLVKGVKKIACNVPEKFWTEPDAAVFSVRGPNYLVDKKKAPSNPSGFHLVGVDLFQCESSSDVYNIGRQREHVFSEAAEFTFIINMVVPGPENMALVFYYQPARPNLFSEGSPFSELLNDFIDGDDEFRNSRFKLIPTVVNGSFMIKQAVGSKPALIGNKLNCPYHKGAKYFEIDIDIASNSVANTVVGMVKGVTKTLVVDIAFLFESQTEEELPENVLGTVRLQNISLDDPVRIPKTSG